MAAGCPKACCPAYHTLDCKHVALVSSPPKTASCRASSSPMPCPCCPPAQTLACEDFAALATSCPALQNLALYDIPVSGRPFGPLANLPKLTSLRVCGVFTYGDVAAAIGSLPPLAALTRLELWSSYSQPVWSSADDSDAVEGDGEEAEDHDATDAAQAAFACFALWGQSRGGARQQQKDKHLLATRGALSWMSMLTSLRHLHLHIQQDSAAAAGAAAAAASEAVAAAISTASAAGKLDVSRLLHLTRLQLNCTPAFSTGVPAGSTSTCAWTSLVSVSLPTLDTAVWSALATMPCLAEVRRGADRAGQGTWAV